MDSSLLSEWEGSGLQFLCTRCAYTDGKFNISASLSRLAASIEGGSLMIALRTERLLMRTYGVSLPERISKELASTQDPTATRILQQMHPILLKSFTPLSIVGDGNCLFRAVSRRLFGTENQHMIIRLLTALEIAEHPNYYNTKSQDYNDLINDNRLLHHDDYELLLRTTCTSGGFSEILVMYAVRMSNLKIILLIYPIYQ